MGDFRQLLPYVDDADTGGFWRATDEGRLAICTCGRCGAFLHLPRSYCHACGAWEPAWMEMSGFGSIYSWTCVEHQVHPSFPAPYALALVELDDAPGIRLLGSIPGRPDLQIGLSVEVWFDRLSDTVVLPQWRPTSPSVSGQ